jgi:hypothetical protein
LAPGRVSEGKQKLQEHTPSTEFEGNLLVYCRKKCYPMVSVRIEYDVKEEDQMTKDMGKSKDKEKKKKKKVEKK